MSKMTDEQIIKALECCIKPTSDCDNCPLYIRGDGDCIDKAKQGALDIINRQQAKNEKLNVELVGMRGACNSYKMHYDNAKAEIERLRIRLRKVRSQFTALSKMHSEIRAEAIKEFAGEIISDLLPKILVGYDAKALELSFAISNKLKEMVGEGK